jgi:prophage DNA circulation protein
MSWRDNLYDPAFRDASFTWLTSDADIGRRVQRHEYPNQDDPYHEDLGRKTRVHSLEGYVSGPNCDVLAAKLRAALEAPGAGTLIHPTLGEMRVVVVSARERQSTREGGMVIFSMTFEVSGEQPRPRVTAVPLARIDATSDDALWAVQNTFKSGFNVDGLPQFVADDAASQFTGSIDTIQGAFSDLRQGEQTLAGWVNTAADMKARALTLVRDPSQLAYELADFIGVSLDLPGAQLSRSLARLFDFGSSTPAIAATTATRQAQQANRVSFFALVRQNAVIQAAKAAVREEYPNRTEALARRDQVAATIESEMLTAPDTSYRQLSALRSVVIKGLDVQAAQLPRLKKVTPITTRPALALAHDLYGDDPELALSMTDDLVARNKVRHPGFVPGGDDLEVSVNG